MSKHHARDDRRMKVESLTEADLEQIDHQLQDNASRHWCKVSRIVLTTMIEREDGITGLPEEFYIQRVATLVKEGHLEGRGDFSDMHLSEVRLVHQP